jgi:hypothetical protein
MGDFDYLIKRGMYNSTVGLLGPKRELYLDGQSCKDFIHDAITHAFYPEYAVNYGVYDYRLVKTPLNPERLEAYVFVRGDEYDRCHERFSRVIADLEERMGLERRVEVFYLNGEKKSGSTRPIVASLHPFWFKTPVAVSMFLSLFRGAEAIKKEHTFDGFMDDVIARKVNWRDAGYLRVANHYGNINGFISRSLPCMSREGFSDYLLSHHSRGIAWYHAQDDAQYPMREEELKAIRNFKRPNNTYYNSAAWGAFKQPTIQAALTDLPVTQAAY